MRRFWADFMWKQASADSYNYTLKRRKNHAFAQVQAIQRIFSGYERPDKAIFRCQGNARGKNLCDGKTCFTDNVATDGRLPNENFCAFNGRITGKEFVLAMSTFREGEVNEYGKCSDDAHFIWANMHIIGANGPKVPDVIINPIATIATGSCVERFPILTAIRWERNFDTGVYEILPQPKMRSGRLNEYQPRSPLIYLKRGTSLPVNESKEVEFWLLHQPNRKTAIALAGNLAPLLTSHKYKELTLGTVHPIPLTEGDEFFAPPLTERSKHDRGYRLYRSPVLLGKIKIKLLK